MTEDYPEQVDLARILELAMDLICTATFEGYFKTLSPSWERTLGWSLDELRSRRFLAFVHPDDVAATETELARLGEGTTTIAFENRYRTKSGSWRWLEWKARPALDEGVVYAAARDVTARKETERLRSEFVSSVSHELRTPLTAIRGSLALLTSRVVGDLSDEAAELLGIAEASTGRLIRLINDLLALEKLEAGAAPLVRRLVKVRSFLAGALQETACLAQEQGISVELDMPDPEAEFICDPDRMIQVLVNLLGNALKFAPESSVVTVFAGIEPDGSLRLQVRDEGAGVPKELLPRLFHRFSQAGSVGHEGSGLGLSICRAIVEQHGGSIRLVEEELGGAVFEIVLPSPDPESSSIAEVGRATPRDWDILVVEDDRQLGALILALLGRNGYSPNLVSTLGEAIEAIEARVPRLVLLDLELRGEPGLQLWEKLRNDPRTRGVPVVFASGHLPEKDMKRLPFIRGWLKKPFTGAQLLEAVAEALQLEKS